MDAGKLNFDWSKAIASAESKGLVIRTDMVAAVDGELYDLGLTPEQFDGILDLAARWLVAAMSGEPLAPKA